jgi:hypothetical protein
VRVEPLAQSRYAAGRAIVRPDGSLLIPGTVGVTQYTGEGVGFEHEEEAAVSLTSALKLDPSFGGPTAPARLSVRLPAQRAVADASRRTLRVAVDATTSGPGLALLEVRARGVLIARSTAPVLRTGGQRLRALLTVRGRRELRHAHRVSVMLQATFRDLVGQIATASARGRLD